MFGNFRNAFRSKTEPVVYYGRHNDVWPARPEYAHLFSRFCAFCGLGESSFTSESDAERDARDHARTHPGVAVQREERRS
jgi:hypothetical protein